jgi:hypothetical protein
MRNNNIRIETKDEGEALRISMDKFVLVETLTDIMQSLIGHYSVIYTTGLFNLGYRSMPETDDDIPENLRIAHEKEREIREVFSNIDSNNFAEMEEAIEKYGKLFRDLHNIKIPAI